jgi:uncharacterized membrane protein YgdD (TMEM256/DUF423 family)
MIKFTLMSGAVLAMLSVILGAFAAHGLKSKISEQMLGVFQTGVQYQFYHALALLFIGLLLRHNTSSLLMASVGFMLGGVVLFSGSLYALALTGYKWVGPITPLGGVCLIIGWLLLSVFIFKSDLS